MSLLKLSAGGSWTTSFNTNYSASTGHGTWSDPYATNYYTANFTVTYWDVGTSNATGYSFSTAYFTGVETFFPGCVQIDSHIDGGTIAKNVNIGDELILADEKTLDPGKGIVSFSKTKVAPGFIIKTENNCSLRCSSSAPIPTRDHGCLTPDKLLNQYIGTKIGENVEWSKVNVVESIGNIDIQHITVGEKCFWAGEQDGKYILHHNLKEEGFDSRYTEWVTSHITSTAYITYFNTTYSGGTNWDTITGHYTQNYYTTNYTTNWNVVTNRQTGNV
jgi:hypothetical protein